MVVKSDRAKGLMAVYGKSLVELNPQDAQRLGLQKDGKVSVTSARSIEAQVYGSLIVYLLEWFMPISTSLKFLQMILQLQPWIPSLKFRNMMCVR